MIDLSKERTKKEWNALMQSVKDNYGNVLTVEQQSFYIDEINYKLTGKRKNDIDILKQIEESQPFYGDIIGQVER